MTKVAVSPLVKKKTLKIQMEGEGRVITLANQYTTNSSFLCEEGEGDGKWRVNNSVFHLQLLY